MVPSYNKSLSLLLFPLVLGMACSDDTESVMTPDASTSIPDTGAHPDATTNLGADAGINVDADLTPDAEPPDWDFGTKIADIPADLIAVTPDEKEVIYVKRVLNRDRIFAYETETGMTREIDSNSTYSIYTTNKDETRGIVTTRPVMWYFSDLLRNVSESGKLRTYNTMTKDVTLVAEDAAKDVLAVSPNGAWAIATEAYDVERGTDSSTRTADVIMLSADGSEKITLIQNASMGLWDGSEDSFAGRCALRAAWTSSVTVAMIGCPSSTKQATLYIADVVTKTSSVVSENASGYLNANSDYEYFFWSTRDGDVYVSSTDTSTTIKLVATSTVEEISFIDERRFAFNTVADELHIASWPVTTSTIIQTFGVENIRRVSPTKDYLLFSQSDDFISDLYKISTSTTQIDRFTQLEVNGQAYPGDDAFSVDGERVFWYQRTNPNLIGDITTALTDGTGPEVELTRQAYWVFNYADPTRVVLLVNAVQIRQGRIISDLVTRARDGSDDLEVLVGGLLAQPRDFLLFPKTKQIAYHVPEGYAPGIYIRELP